MPAPRRDKPWAYFITFTCYGARLHGDNRGSVDRGHNSFGARFLEANPLREAYQRKRMSLKPVTLDEAGRAIVLRTIQEVCRHQDWTLYAVHVRATHLHIVVSAELPPEQVMGKFKAYANRGLNLNEHEGQRRRRWSRHGSTRRLWSPVEVDATVEYVLRRQGQPMAVYEKLDRWSHL